MIASDATGLPPVHVAGEVRSLRDLSARRGLSEDFTWPQKRDACLNDLSGMFGRNPLVMSRFSFGKARANYTIVEYNGPKPEFYQEGEKIILKRVYVCACVCVNVCMCFIFTQLIKKEKKKNIFTVSKHSPIFSPTHPKLILYLLNKGVLGECMYEKDFLGAEDRTTEISAVINTFLRHSNIPLLVREIEAKYPYVHEFIIWNNNIEMPFNSEEEFTKAQYTPQWPVRVVNSKENVFGAAKFRGCQMAVFSVCYYQVGAFCFCFTSVFFFKKKKNIIIIVFSCFFFFFVCLF